MAKGTTAVRTFWSGPESSKVSVTVPVGGNKWPMNVRMMAPKLKSVTFLLCAEIFGVLISCLNTGDNLASTRFTGVHNFNLLLQEYRPNVILAAPVFFETYSYTLTLSMLTKLPIIARQPPLGLETTIASRLKQYPQVALHDFGDVEEVVALARQR